MADVWAALANETRRVLLDELVARDGQSPFEPCTRLAMRHGIGSSRQAVSQRLQVLEDVGLVHTEWDGRTRLHHVDTAPLPDLVGRWLDPSRDDVPATHRQEQ